MKGAGQRSACSRCGPVGAVIGREKIGAVGQVHRGVIFAAADRSYGETYRCRQACSSVSVKRSLKSMLDR